MANQRVVDRLPNVEVPVCAFSQKAEEIINLWPGGTQAAVEAINEDLVIMGATHKCVGHDSTILMELMEARRAGLKLIPMITYLTYGEELSNVQFNIDNSWPWLDGLNESGLIRYISDLWVSDDVTDDSDEDPDQGPLMRAHIIAQLPNMPLMVSPTVGASAGYVNTIQTPVPNKIQLQLYPFHASQWISGNIPDPDYIEALIVAQLAAARPADGFFFQAFGHEDWEEDISGESWGNQFYRPAAGWLLATMQRAWTAGHRGYYGIFNAIWPDNTQTALYDRALLLNDFCMEDARTYLWYEVRAFVDWVDGQF